MKNLFVNITEGLYHRYKDLYIDGLYAIRAANKNDPKYI